MNFFKKILGLSDKIDKIDISEIIYGVTDVGKIRKGNEDCFLIRPDKNLFIAADGMGGHNAGEIASMRAVESVNNYFTPELLAEISGNHDKIKEEMIKSLLDAHKNVIEMAKSKPRYRGMGCTIVIALTDGNHLHLCHVGDARAYVCNSSGIKLLTTDHSVVMTIVKAGKMTMEEARKSPIKNEITQAIGVPAKIAPEYDYYHLKDGDKILLCSDGLWDMLSDDSIYKFLKQKKPANITCEELVRMANKAGGRDNITVIVVVHKS